MTLEEVRTKIKKLNEEDEDLVYDVRPAGIGWVMIFAINPDVLHYEQRKGQFPWPSTIEYTNRLDFRRVMMLHKVFDGFRIRVKDWCIYVKTGVE